MFWSLKPPNTHDTCCQESHGHSYLTHAIHATFSHPKVCLYKQKWIHIFVQKNCNFNWPFHTTYTSLYTTLLHTTSITCIWLLVLHLCVNLLFGGLFFRLVTLSTFMFWSREPPIPTVQKVMDTHIVHMKYTLHFHVITYACTNKTEYTFLCQKTDCYFNWPFHTTNTSLYTLYFTLLALRRSNLNGWLLSI